MSIRPVDFKTTLYNAEDASRVADMRKNHDAGVDGQIVQNRNEASQKSETVQNTQNTEGQVIRKDDESRGNASQQNGEKKNKQEQEEEQKEKSKFIPDGIHGHFDFRA